VGGVLCALVTAYMLVLLVRVILSWIPMRGDSPLTAVNRIVMDLTEPVLAPMRRIIPPAGIFDLSVIILFFILQIVRTQVCY
jgi:YggT family protein